MSNLNQCGWWAMLISFFKLFKDNLLDKYVKEDNFIIIKKIDYLLNNNIVIVS